MIDYLFVFTGNIVSNGHIVQDSGGIQNAHFGITKSGHLFIG